MEASASWAAPRLVTNAGAISGEVGVYVNAY